MHTIQTIRILLSSLYYDNLLCLDVIVTTNKEPIIVCSERLGNEILSEKSPFWATLFSLLNGINDSDLASGIKTAYNIITVKVDHTNKWWII